MHTLITGPVVAALLVLTVGSASLRAGRTLDGRLLAVRRMLLFLAFALLALAAGVVFQPGSPVPSGVDGMPPAVFPHLVELQGADRSLRLAVAGALVIVAGAMLLASWVVRQLASFVLTHRLDLAARDEIAARATTTPAARST